MRSKVLLFVFTITFMACINYLGIYYLKSVQAQKSYDRLAEIVALQEESELEPTVSSTPTPTPSPTPAITNEPEATPTSTLTPTPTPYIEPDVLAKYQELYDLNNDLAGCLQIPGTIIDYPVVLKDNDYYLRRNFFGEDETAGCLFIDEHCTIVPERTTNIMIYGHNMHAGTMFADLHKFKEQSFFEENRYIYFDTIYEEATYEIAAVFLSQVFNTDDNVFKFYKFIDADTEEDFDYFAENVKELAMYDTGVSLSYGDDILTLITCSPHLEEKKGRLVVIAKRIE